MFDFYFFLNYYYYYYFVCGLIVFFFPRALRLARRQDGDSREADYYNPQKYRKSACFECVCVCVLMSECV